MNFCVCLQLLGLELSDLVSQINKEIEAATRLLVSPVEDIPPQLLMALDKDKQSLSRTFDAAVEFAQSALQGMQSYRDAQKVSLTCTD